VKDLDNFKEIADDILKSVKVSDELKDKTLSKCTKGTSWQKGLSKTVAALAVSAAVIMIIFTSDSFIPPAATTGDKSGSGKSIWSPVTKNDKGISDEPSKSTDEGLLERDNIAKAPVKEGAYYEDRRSSYKLGTKEQAADLLEGAFTEPAYVPLGFMKKSIHLPGYMDDDEGEVVLTYIKGEEVFWIRQKKVSTIDFVTGEGQLDEIDSATRRYTKVLESSSEPEYIRIIWMYNGIFYTIEGALSQEEAIKVVESIK
jgi:hypothetical protein